MKTMLKLAVAASALAIASAANANPPAPPAPDATTTQQVIIKGQSLAFCKVTSGTPSAGGVYDGTGATTFDFGTSFVNNDGVGLPQSGNVHYVVNANGACAFTVASTSGGLANTSVPAGTVTPLDYTVYLGGSAPDIHTNYTDVGSLSNVEYDISDGITPKLNNDVYLGFKYAGSANQQQPVLNAGKYQDTLTITIKANP